MTENKNRCVVTGLGMISAVGNNVDECWDSAVKARSGIDHTKTVDTVNCYSDYAAEVHCGDIETEGFDRDADRVVKLCIKAVSESMSDAGLKSFEGSDRVSVIMGSCVGGVVSIEHYYTQGKDKKDILKMPISAIANHVAEYVGAGGVVTNVANACAAGTISIAYAADLIRAGIADIVIAGGADAFASVPYAGFLSLHALDDQPCSPFNKSKGITLGEGAGCVIVESYEHAKARKAKMYCEVLGSGISSDAHHITAPRPDGEGQMNAILAAIKTSGVKRSDIDYVNAHGTGTAKNDEAEFLSLHTIFDGENDGLCVSSTKALTGHCLGAAGAIEAVFAIKALTTDTLPPTANYTEEDIALLGEKAGKLDFLPNKAKKKKLDTVMSNSFAFGGNNASIVFGKHPGDVKTPHDKPEICITGIGIVSPVGNGVENYISAVKSNKNVEGGSVRSAVSSADYDPLGLKMAFYRKLDNFSQLQVVSGMYALKDAGYEITDDNVTDIGIIVGTSEGALGPGCDFEMLIAERGNAGGSAFKFPNTVYNAAGGYLSICSGIKGYNVTIANGAQAGLQSMAYSMGVMRGGVEQAMLATGSDENTAIINELYAGLDLVADEFVPSYSENNKLTLGEGSVSVLAEDLSSAKKRNAKIYCRVVGCGMAHSAVPFGTVTGSDSALDSAVNKALADSGLNACDIDAVIGFANGIKAVDDIELNWYSRTFTDAKPPIISVRSFTGEARAASAMLSLAHGALMLSGNIDNEHNAYIMENGKAVKRDVDCRGMKNILVTACGTGGSYTAVVLKK